MIDYEAQKEKDFENVKEKFNSAFAELKQYNEEWSDWTQGDQDGYESNFNSQIIHRCLVEFEFKLRHFKYDNIWYNRCGDRYGTCSGLLTSATENEVKVKMKEYAEKCISSSDSYCHHKFLNSISNLGIYYSGYSSHDYYEKIAYEISLNNISEKDILSLDRYSEVIKMRKEAARIKQEAEELLRNEKLEQAERSQYEQLKNKYS